MKMSQFDIVSALNDFRLLHLIEDIADYVGYSGLVSMMCVCKQWYGILTEDDIWTRLAKRRQVENRVLVQHRIWSGWSSRRIVYETSGVRVFLLLVIHDIGLDSIIFISFLDLKDRSLVKTPVLQIYGRSTVLIDQSVLLYQDFLICGTNVGQIHIWDLSDTAARVSPDRILADPPGSIGWTRITCLDCCDGILASGELDTSIRLWNLESGTLLRVLRGDKFNDFMTTLLL